MSFLRSKEKTDEVAENLNMIFLTFCLIMNIYERAVTYILFLSETIQKLNEITKTSDLFRNTYGECKFLKIKN